MDTVGDNEKSDQDYIFTKLADKTVDIGGEHDKENGDNVDPTKMSPPHPPNKLKVRLNVSEVKSDPNKLSLFDDDNKDDQKNEVNAE